MKWENGKSVLKHTATTITRNEIIHSSYCICLFPNAVYFWMHPILCIHFYMQENKNSLHFFCAVGIMVFVVLYGRMEDREILGGAWHFAQKGSCIFRVFVHTLCTFAFQMWCILCNVHCTTCRPLFAWIFCFVGGVVVVASNRQQTCMHNTHSLTLATQIYLLLLYFTATKRWYSFNISHRCHTTGNCLSKRCDMIIKFTF